MSELKPYLADVPVRVNIWIREECQRKQFEVLKEARPSVMFLVSDGGRNEKEWEAIKNNRAIFDNEIDWDCTVYKIYEDKNNGLYTMSKKGAELIWSTVDRCIFLEDDQIVSVSYFKFCEELLEKYKNDTRIQAICAMNHVGVWEDATSDYFFTAGGAIWGLATWKRTHLMRDYEFTYLKDPYVYKLLKETMDNSFAKKSIESIKNTGLHDGHMPGGEFFYTIGTYAHNQLFIVPKCNMMSNIGCTADSAHAEEYKLMPKAVKKMFNMKTYELEFPLKHQEYVIRDKNYEKAQKRILGVDHPFVKFARRIESMFLSIRYGVIFKKIKKKRARKNKVEK